MENLEIILLHFSQFLTGLDFVISSFDITNLSIYFRTNEENLGLTKPRESLDFLRKIIKKANLYYFKIQKLRETQYFFRLDFWSLESTGIE